MEKYEYINLHLDMTHDFNFYVNQLAEEGWVLVNTVYIPNDYELGDSLMFWFKRRLRE